MTPTLEDAIILAARAHRGQVDKGGQPYILHLLRVMLRQEDETARLIAVLHDLLEDTHVTLADLRTAGYSEQVCAAVDCLTRRPGEAYEEMIERIATNPLARQVKLADLADNLDPKRPVPAGSAAADRQARYEAARKRLLAGDWDGRAAGPALDTAKGP
jgi:(p)ppGpp synthase/HD superfamily hydrolase